jgi:hypothetical protein
VTTLAGPYYADESVTVHHGDCLHVLRDLPADSVDAVVTDPPAGISFMGKSWDGDKGGRERWSAWLAEIMREALRVTKPGGHAFVWALPRTSHWTACGVEDAGWEIRDRVVHLFGTGFPKSKNLGDGWGTALKPAAEDWWLCRKPFQGTVAANVLAHGTGALNIDGTRVESGTDYHDLQVTQGGHHRHDVGLSGDSRNGTFTPAAGRWPANVLLDGDAAAELDATGPHTKDGVAVNRNRPEEGSTYGASSYMIGDRRRDDVTYGGEGGPSRFFPTFRYQAKAPAWERPKVNGVAHPTCKPSDLVRWLARLVCPPGGVILDPFAGSGTTVEAAIIEGFRCVAVEREADYLPLILARMQRGRAAVKARSVTEALPPTAGQLNLFTEGTA